MRNRSHSAHSDHHPGTTPAESAPPHRAEAIAEFLDGIRREFDEDSAAVLERAFLFAEGLAPKEQAALARMARGLLDHGVDAEALSSAVLAPLLWEHVVTEDQVQASFGKAVSDLTTALPRPAQLRTDTEDNRRRDLQQLLESLSSDVRAAVLAAVHRLQALDRVVEGNRAEGPPPEFDARAYAVEALDIYVPLCGRLGLGALRQQLEDRAFQILDPPGYDALAREVAPLREEDETAMRLLRRAVSRHLEHHEIPARVHGRVKGLYSLHRKMRLTGRSLPEVMDKIGLRIIVSSVPECYAALGILHTHYRPVPGSFKDYIGLPKENGYRSLHTCVYPIQGLSEKPVEIQIRTEAMHLEAEFGVAAHWRYKSEREAAEAGARQIAWLRSLPRQHRESRTHEDFVERLRRQVFEDQVVVFGPGGGRYQLAEGETVADFLLRFDVDADARPRVEVNGKHQELDYVLRDGDTIELPGELGPPCETTPASV